MPGKIKSACLNMFLNWQIFIFHHCHGLLAWYLHMYSFPSISTWEYATPLSPAAGMFSSSSNISDSSQTKHFDSIHPEDVTYIHIHCTLHHHHRYHKIRRQPYLKRLIIIKKTAALSDKTNQPKEVDNFPTAAQKPADKVTAWQEKAAY